MALAAVLCVGTACRRGGDRVLDPANELPFGHLDQPLDHSQSSSQISTGGWAMDDRGVTEIRLYIDGHLAEATPLNTERPDVSKVFPQYARTSNLHGWSAVLVFEAPGPHTILAQAVDTNGATHDLGTVAVTSTDK
jgi:hypothetical protein